MSRFKKCVALDFDGVIHSYTSPWAGVEIISDPPVPGVMEYMEELLDHFEVTIFSARARDRLGVAAIRRYLRHHWVEAGCEEPKLYMIEITGEKPQAVIYIDDRGYHFTGTFPTIEEIQNFKPWNR